ncbi:MAG: hypothetical protein QM780_03800 [Hyphomicrobium sp.]|uniref:hypothetical protein n=1 Tax=Hyphomicrobium sp. TaxID=82 RepID=UPI0039E227E7
MSKRIALGAAMGIAALVSVPAASQAHCFGYKHVRSEVTAAVDGTTTFVRRVADRTEKFGHRLFGWLDCKKI